MGQTDSRRKTIVDRAIEILLLFDEEHPVLTAPQVSRRLGMSRSTTYRHIQSLRDHGLLEDGGASGGYRLGPRVFRLARIARSGLGLADVALPFMRQLSQETREVVLLTRSMGRSVVCVERVEAISHPAIRISYERGQSLPRHAGASAKVHLAFGEPAELEELLDEAPLQRHTDRTITDPELLRKELAEIRDRGYAFSDGEVDEGLRAVAAPVLDSDGRVVAGLSVIGLSFRVTDDVLPSVIDAVRNAAEALGARMRELEF